MCISCLQRRTRRQDLIGKCSDTRTERMVLSSAPESQLHPNIATRDHCIFAFAVLHSHLTGNPSPLPKFAESRCALFVTWNTLSSGGHWRLRGCIGTLEPKQLHRALHDYALNSGLRDHRFSPIKLKEFPSLQCKVSLLARFEKAAGWNDWVVGTHGIIIHFIDPSPGARGARRTATFLPDVAPEQGWDQQQAIDALIRKAGYDGPINLALRESISLERYQSTIACITYEEFVTTTMEAEEEDGVGLSEVPAREVPVQVAT